MTISDPSFLSEEMEFIKDSLLECDVYSFSEDVKARMITSHLSSSELGRRCEISHTIVDKWRSGTVHPNGKERMKELGMALGMDESELNVFLYRNGYPRLSSKNPYDSAARLLLIRCAGDEEIVHLYRELINRLSLSDYSVKRADSLTSAVMSIELMQAAQDGNVSEWFRQHRGKFSADDKNTALSQRLMQYVSLYIGDTTINELTVTGELPAALRNLLYPMMSGKTIAVRFLREKLICLGLYLNMTEDEINTLLRLANLREITDPTSREELALLLAVRNGHEQYPYYEYDNLCTVLARLKEHNSGEWQLMKEYGQRLEFSRQLVDYYDSCTQRNDTPTGSFEKQYTSYSDKGLMDYVHDLLSLLCEEGYLTRTKIENLIEYTTRPE